MHHGAIGARNSSTAAAQNSLTSFLLSYGPNKPDLNSINYKIYGVYSSVNMSCISTKVKSSSDWFNLEKAVIQHGCFCVFDR